MDLHRSAGYESDGEDELDDEDAPDRIEFMFTILNKDLPIAIGDLTTSGWSLISPYYEEGETKTWLVFAPQEYIDDEKCKCDISVFSKTWLKKWYKEPLLYLATK